jgi:hypothetical protein
LTLWIGAKTLHPEIKLSDVQEAVCKAGFIAGMNAADAYIARFMTPMSQEAGKEDPAGKADAGN